MNLKKLVDVRALCVEPINRASMRALRTIRSDTPTVIPLPEYQTRKPSMYGYGNNPCILKRRIAEKNGKRI
jgi:hypothetical protein